MRTFNVPVKAEVSPNNQAIFDNLQKGLGFVPNLYAVMAYSEHRRGAAPFDAKLDALTKLTEAITRTKGRPDATSLDAFFNAGYTNGHLVEVVIAIADKVVMNYLHNIMQVPIDFPLAPELELATA